MAREDVEGEEAWQGHALGRRERHRLVAGGLMVRVRWAGTPPLRRAYLELERGMSAPTS